MYHAALCIYEMVGESSPRVTTAHFVYVRFHHPAGDHTWAYDCDALKGWAEAISSWTDKRLSVYCYFNNDPEAAAPQNANELSELLGVQRRRTKTIFSTAITMLMLVLSLNALEERKWVRR